MIQIWLYLLAGLLDCNKLVPNTVSPRLAGLGRAPHSATSPEVCVVWVGSATFGFGAQEHPPPLFPLFVCRYAREERLGAAPCWGRAEDAVKDHAAPFPDTPAWIEPAEEPPCQ